MSNRKIIQLMQVLGRFDTGFEEFEAYLLLPASDTTLQLRSLFAYFEKYFGRYNAANLNPKKIFREIYQEGAVYKSRKVSEPIRELTALLDDFLPSFAARVDPELRSEIRRRLYHKNHKEALFYEHLELPDKVPLKSLGSRQAQEQMNNYDDFYAFQPEEKSEQELTTSLVNYRKLNRVCYEINELKACCKLINREVQYGHTVASDLRQKLRNFIDNLVYREVLLVNALALSAEFYLEPNVEQYESFKAFFVENLEELPEDKFDLLDMLLNGLSYVIPPNGLINEYFFLYKLGDENNILAKNNYMRARLYLDVVHSAFRLDNQAWAENFRKNYKSLLSKKSIKVVEITEAYFEFGRAEYKLVIDRLKKRHFRNDIALSLKKYPLILKSMYMLKGQEEFLDLNDAIRSFKDLLKRQKKQLTDTVYERYFNFAKFLKALEKNKVSKESFLERLEENRDKLVEIPWLEKILEQL